MVSISILSILFLLLFVPLLTSMGLLSQGQGDIKIQDTLRTVLARIERELKSAMFVFPNDGGSTTLTAPVIPPLMGSQPWVLEVKNGAVFQPGSLVRIGVPGQADYATLWTVQWVTLNRIAVYDPAATNRQLLAQNLGAVVTGAARYYDSINADGPPQLTCGNALRAAVLSRLDLQLPHNILSGGGSRVLFPLQAEPQLVTYYVRRRDPATAYDEIDNPLVLYRAQYVQPVVNFPNQDPCHVTGSSQSGWLRDNANLEPVASNQTSPIGLHTALTPTEDLNVLGRTVTDPATNNTKLISDTTFTTEDSDGDGRVDRITINLVIGRYDAARRETVRETLRQTIELKNAR